MNAPVAAAVPALRTHYRTQKNQLLQTIAQSSTNARGVRKALRQLSQLADVVLKWLWLHAELGHPCALLAVGGFGRQELFPHSDVDVLVLVPDTHAPDNDLALTQRIEAFIGSCWDVGLEIGSSVRTLSNCLAEAQKDVTIQTALLENRLIVGNAALATQFQQAFFAALDPRDYFFDKTLEMRQRHTKFENTPYSLEPNCKESPGGLRDLQVILWVAKAAGYGQSWTELVASGLATAFEAQQIKRNESLLFLIRARLHVISHRREDRLIFDLQNAVAETFGHRAPPAEGDARAFVRASEAMMKRYYWAAKAVAQLNQILMLNIEERLNPSTHALRPINERFNDKAGMIDVVSDDLYLKQPHAILETFLVYQTSVGMKDLSARTLR
ncbi:MAG: [protein-PII] uridylyltransferase, partial [Rhodoferax sp.]